MIFDRGLSGSVSLEVVRRLVERGKNRRQKSNALRSLLVIRFLVQYSSPPHFLSFFFCHFFSCSEGPTSNRVENIFCWQLCLRIAGYSICFNSSFSITVPAQCHATYFAVYPTLFHDLWGFLFKGKERRKKTYGFLIVIGAQADLQ